nr:RHS repeat-associated core domain-containing protein [Longimicrobium terrae]
MRDASGQMYMRNRYYDPATSQFTQTDPIGLAGGLNSYGFAAGDPVGYSDPYGLCPDATGMGSLQCAMQDVVGAIQAAPGMIARGAGRILRGLGWTARTSVRVTIGNPIVQEVGMQLATDGAINVVRAGRLGGKLIHIADEMIVVRGGTGPIPGPGEVFSGAFGSTLDEAAAAVPHGTIQATTAGEIRAAGGTVTHAPEMTRGGVLNERHVDICKGSGPCPFGQQTPNPIPKKGRIQ